MSRFTGPLTIREVVPGQRWALAEPLRYEVDCEGSRRWITVPRGFETDGATIPPILRPFLAVWGTYGRAAALHDYLYAQIRAANRRGVPGDRLTIPCRAEADRQFYLAMRACGTAPWLARLIWLAVRAFGARAAR